MDLPASPPTRPEAIMLDLFGTLVDTFSCQAHEQALTAMAGVLGLARADFAAHWAHYQRDNR